MQLLALVLLSIAIIFRGLVRSSLSSWILALLVAGLGLIGYTLDLLRFALYLPPVILPLLLWAVFFRSLMPGRTPLITGIARAVRGSLSDELSRYTRSVTVVWCTLFISLSLGSVLLPLVASPQVWSLFANFLNYVFIVLLFVGEFIYRQYRFRDLEHLDFLSYLQSLRQVGMRQFR
ncbi:MAG: hypothetical protein U5K56_21395 [Halioglobus sp.]|nr:hypothetical protein [Halioglobus sp.]